MRIKLFAEYKYAYLLFDNILMYKNRTITLYDLEQKIK